jgi:hypothetical protein
MHPDFPPSIDRLFRIVRRTPSRCLPSVEDARGVYTVVESSLASPNLDQAIAYFEQTYGHDEANGTEIIFTSNRGDFYVLRAHRRVRPEIELVPVRVA